jgi:glutaconate CoA-transferase subunit A
VTQRASKVRQVDDVARLVAPGMTLAIGGFWYHNQPAAFARALVRAGARDLKLTGAPVGSYVHDLLIGAGAVSRLMTPHVSFDELGLSPSLRIAAESGQLVIDECDEATLIGAFRAGGQGLPTMPVQSLRLSGVIDQCSWATTNGNSDGGSVAAIVPDVAVIHVAYADRFGNGCHLLSPFADRLLARLSKRVVLTTERLVENALIRADPRHTTILGMWVDDVLELPGGARPGSCHGVYGEDLDELRRYVAAAEARRQGDQAPFNTYIKDDVLCTEDVYRLRHPYPESPTPAASSNG